MSESQAVLPSLPPGWEWVALEDLALHPTSDIVDGPFGSNLKASEYQRDGVPIIRLQNVDRNQFIEKNIRYITTQKASELKRHGFVPGDIVITKLGDPLGEVCIVPESIGSGVIVADVVRVRLDERFLSKRYLVHTINSGVVAGQLKRTTKGTTRPRVNLTHIRQLRIPFAPLSEQSAIVDEIEKLLTQLDIAVAALKRVWANLKRYRASVLKAACEGRLVPTEAELSRSDGRDYETGEQLLARILKERRAKREANQLAKMHAAGRPPKDDRWKAKYREPAPPDTSSLPQLPEGWVWATLAQLSWDAGYGTSEKCDFGFSGPPVVRIPNIVRGRLELSDLKFAKPQSKVDAGGELAPGDFLVIRTNGSRDLIGRAALVDRQFNRDHFFASYLIRFRILGVPCLGEWMNLVWDTVTIRKEIERLAATSAGQYNVSLGALSGIPLPLPPTSEMPRILAQAKRRLLLGDNLEPFPELNLKRADRLRQAVLKSAFEGKLVPQDPNDEPAGALLERIGAERAKFDQAAKPAKGSMRRPSRRSAKSEIFA